MPLGAKTVFISSSSIMEIILHFVNFLWLYVTFIHFNFNSSITGRDLLKLYYEMTFHMPVMTRIFLVISLVFK